MQNAQDSNANNKTIETNTVSKQQIQKAPRLYQW